MTLTGTNRSSVLGDKFFPVPLCLPQIPGELHSRKLSVLKINYVKNEMESEEDAH